MLGSNDVMMIVRHRKKMKKNQKTSLFIQKELMI